MLPIFTSYWGDVFNCFSLDYRSFSIRQSAAIRRRFAEVSIKSVVDLWQTYLSQELTRLSPLNLPTHPQWNS